MMEFHVSRAARDRYQFSETLFALNGNVIIANFHAARLFAQKMNERRDLVRFPEQTVRAGQLNAMGLIDEILHFVIGLYREQQKPHALALALAWLESTYGRATVDKALCHFADEFPSVAVYTGQIDARAYLNDGVLHRQLVLEEMLMLWLANVNPAFGPFGELFDDRALARETAYRELMAGLWEFFKAQPVFGPESQSLLEMLRSPAIAVPDSLPGQLKYILEKWGYLLGKYSCRLLVGQDLIKEEHKTGFLGAGPAEVYQFTGQETEPERFSQDLQWMPRLVLLAKNVYVWLDQLSRKYQRTLRTLDQVPDEELTTLARWGFSGLWLIGLWERSRASQTIKQHCGNPEALASAYSLDDYHIAADLGGEAALQNLKERAWRRGIRLASDMVPNHMGIDSRWVIEHPERFLALDYCPYPSYTFNGPDLSTDGRVGIFLEDHYYARSDAAVVFKRLDRRTGSTRYVYHGNDGTAMPWNDTAQLNYLDPQVREAVIQTILEVARKFSVIRFDAAMTLAKKHIQRLWFPEPGSGGAIPSRADHSLTREQFDARIPIEFWREVVDHVAREVPDTLLLAEAFWMMEGYFVRTLGMHRVYNSAFMNMLKNEENANYRSVIKNTLEFNPEVLKRFVNFMNNPDEQTAVAQFGKGDKYFGVCTLMATMPGLPMFGHGQVEGFIEKYGMEYRRAYCDEPVDRPLVERHERAIFTLLRRRHLFAEVDHFYMYDLFAPEGHVNEDVFAYSNRAGEERALVLYHNKYSTARGWIRMSVGYLGKTGRAGRGGDERAPMRKSLAEGLGLRGDDDYFTLFRDHITGLEYIRNSAELNDKGLYVELGAYQHHVFLDFRQVRDNEMHQYAQLAAALQGRGVPSVDEALRDVFLRPIHDPFKELVNVQVFQQLLDARGTDQRGYPREELLDGVEQKVVHLFRAIEQFTGAGGDEAALARVVRQRLDAALELPFLANRHDCPLSAEWQAALSYLQANLGDDLDFWGCLFGWVFIHSLGRALGETDAAHQSRSWNDEWLLSRIVGSTLRDLGLDDAAADKAVRLMGLLTTHQDWCPDDVTGPLVAYRVLEALVKDRECQQFLGANRYQDVVWFTAEALDELLWWLFVVAVIQSSADPQRPADQVIEEIVGRYRVVVDLQNAGKQAECQIAKLLDAVTGRATPRSQAEGVRSTAAALLPAAPSMNAQPLRSSS